LIQSIYDENYVVRLEAERLALVTISIANTADRPQAARFADLKKDIFSSALLHENMMGTMN
jgi:hypothetical protein